MSGGDVMSQRDEIARIIHEKAQTPRSFAFRAADALAAAGLLVPPEPDALKLIHHDADDMAIYTAEEMAEARENFIRLFGYVLPSGLTAEKLRYAASEMRAQGWAQSVALALEFDAAASFLDTQETR